jgi:hypothetical protein
MPKLNAVLMVVLALAVIATAGFLSLEKSPAPAGPDPKETVLLLRKLGDSDPDLRREAEARFRTMGPRALDPLREAARSDDRTLAARATRLLQEIDPAPVYAKATSAAEDVTPETAKVEIVEFVLEARGGQARAVELGGLWVQFRNNGPAPVLVAHAHALDHPDMAAFQVEDASGRRSEIPAEILHLRPTDIEERVSVKPRESILLFQGGKRLVEAVAKPGAYTIRFLYDAREGSPYRRLVQASSEGALLPPVRLVSNTVKVTVTE